MFPHTTLPQQLLRTDTVTHAQLICTNLCALQKCTHCLVLFYGVLHILQFSLPSPSTSLLYTCMIPFPVQMVHTNVTVGIHDSGGRCNVTAEAQCIKWVVRIHPFFTQVARINLPNYYFAIRLCLGLDTISIGLWTTEESRPSNSSTAVITLRFLTISFCNLFVLIKNQILLYTVYSTMVQQAALFFSQDWSDTWEVSHRKYQRECNML